MKDTLQALQNKVTRKANELIKLADENMQGAPSFTEYVDYEELFGLLTEKECEYLLKIDEGFGSVLDRFFGNCHQRRPTPDPEKPKTIKKEATWSHDGITDITSIETWEWDKELRKYALDYLEEKETGEEIYHSDTCYCDNPHTDMVQYQ